MKCKGNEYRRQFGGYRLFKPYLNGWSRYESYDEDDTK